MSNFTVAVIDGQGRIKGLPSGGSLVDVANNQLIDNKSATTRTRLATTGNIADLSTGAPDTVDGVTVQAGDRILVKDQSTLSENGIYVVDTVGTGSDGEWSRASDFDDNDEINELILCQVVDGTANGDTLWQLDSTGGLTIGTSDINFVKVSSNRRQKSYDGAFYLDGRTQLVNADVFKFVVTEAGYLVANTIVIYDARTGGTIDGTLLKNGVALASALDVQINATDTTSDRASQPYQTTGFDVAAGDVITVRLNSTTFAPLTTCGFVSAVVESES